MNDAFLMRGCERFRDLLRHRKRLFQRQRPTTDAICKSVALDQLENQQPRVIDFSEIVNSRDMRMIQSCQGFGLALKSRDSLGIAGKCIGQNLDRNFTLQLCIARAIYLAHAAGAQQAEDFVCTELCSRLECHKCRALYGEMVRRSMKLRMNWWEQERGLKPARDNVGALARVQFIKGSIPHPGEPVISDWFEFDASLLPLGEEIQFLVDAHFRS